MVGGDFIRWTVGGGQVNQWRTAVRTLKTGGLVVGRQTEDGGLGGGILRRQINYLHTLLVLQVGVLKIELHLADGIVLIIDSDNLGYHS